MNVLQRILVRHARRHPDPVLEVFLRELFNGVQGRVVEIGCGCGSLLNCYPLAVTQLVGIELDTEARALAAVEASKLPFPAVITGLEPSGLIPAGNESVDYVVCNEVLCSVADVARVLRDVRRILRPSGELRLFEHVASTSRQGRLVQECLDKLGWPKLLGGCHTSRQIRQSVYDGGFDWLAIEQVWYARFFALYPAGPHIWARASPRQT